MAATGVLVLVALALAAVLTAQWRTPAVPWHAWREAIVYLETSWPFSAAVLAPVVLVVGTGFTGLTKSESPGWWFVVNLVAYLLHQVEEHSLNWHSPTGTGSEQPWRQGFKQVRAEPGVRRQSCCPPHEPDAWRWARAAQLIAKLFSPAASSDWNLLLVRTLGTAITCAVSKRSSSAQRRSAAARRPGVTSPGHSTRHPAQRWERVRWCMAAGHAAQVNVAFVWVPYAASIALAGNAWAEHKAREAIRKRADDEFQETGLPLAITLLRALHMPGGREALRVEPPRAGLQGGSRMVQALPV